MTTAKNRKNIIAGNWKMNLGVEASRALARSLVAASAGLSHSGEIWIAPSSMALAAVAEEIQGSAIRSGAQNVCQQKSAPIPGNSRSLC